MRLRVCVCVCGGGERVCMCQELKFISRQDTILKSGFRLLNYICDGTL